MVLGDTMVLKSAGSLKSTVRRHWNQKHAIKSFKKAHPNLVIHRVVTLKKASVYFMGRYKIIYRDKRGYGRRREPTRIIDGMTYGLHGGYRLKSEAQKKAQWLRNKYKGNQARVLKGKKGWVVYARGRNIW